MATLNLGRGKGSFFAASLAVVARAENWRGVDRAVVRFGCFWMNDGLRKRCDAHPTEISVLSPANEFQVFLVGNLISGDKDRTITTVLQHNAAAIHARAANLY
jgi:hypothetical protein